MEHTNLITSNSTYLRSRVEEDLSIDKQNLILIQAQHVICNSEEQKYLEVDINFLKSTIDKKENLIKLIENTISS